MSNADQFDFIDTLQAALADGTLSLGQHAELQRLVCDVPEARRCYIRLVHQHATLLRLLAAEGGKGVRYILPERPEGCFAQNVPDPFSLCRWTREYFSQPGPLSILAATIFMVCLISLLSILPAPTYQPSRSNHACTTSVSSTTNSPGRKPRDKDGKLKFVARITGLHNCRWSANYLPPLRYAHLGIGRELKLDSGLVKITYYNGAKLVLEGPVEFTVEEANACRLELGKLTAKVSKQAVGFTVETPDATIVDLGTEFGVVADALGTTEVHVFRGAVEMANTGDGISPGGGRPIRIQAGQAMRIDRNAPGEPVAIKLDDRRFARGRFVRSAAEEFVAQESAAIYGPLTYDGYNLDSQGGPYIAAGPGDGQIDISFVDDNMAMTPSRPGHGLVYDTAFATTRASYTIKATHTRHTGPHTRASILGYAVPGTGALGIWALPGNRYFYGVLDDPNPPSGGPAKIEEYQAASDRFFTAADQSTGDGVSDLDSAGGVNLTMEIRDTGDDATSTFRYTFKQNANVWVVEKTFTEFRTAAENDNPGAGGALVDELIAAGRSDTTQTGFAFYLFASPGGSTIIWDRLTGF